MKSLLALITFCFLYSCGGLIPAVAQTETTATESELATAGETAAESQVTTESAAAVTQTLEQMKPEVELHRRWLFGLGIESRMRKKMSSDIDRENQNFASIFIAYREKWFQTLGEIANFQDENTQGTLSMKYTRYEYRQWFRGMLYPEKTWTPFIGAGLGLYQEQIETGFFGERVTNETDFELTGGLEAGLQATLFDVLFASVTFRALQDAPEGIDKGNDEWNWAGQFQLGFSL